MGGRRDGPRGRRRSTDRLNEGRAMKDRGEFPSDLREIRRRVRQHLSAGAVTQNYGGKVEDAIALLNHAVATEIVSILRPRADDEDRATTLEAVERAHILRVLGETNWMLGGARGAAARLGMKRTTLQS